ncbi:MAG: Na+/H+ antiporter NhaC family protein [Gemmatimonadota bacterium]
MAALLPSQGGLDGWSLFPPLVAILVGTLTGQLALGLAAAVLGAAALSQPAVAAAWLYPVEVVRRALVDFIWAPVVDAFQIYILLFTTTLIGMVRVVSLAGGTQGIADLLAGRAEGGRSTRLAAFGLGLAIFFDDYANTLVVGTTMRPVADRFRVAREKLAYLVDSTAAPVAGIAIISTWIGYEVGYFDQIMKDLGAGISGYELFFRALPSRFYCLLTLVFVGATVLLRRDFGPMLQAERRAFHTGQVLRDGARPLAGSRSESLPAAAGVAPHWRTAVVPVVLVVLGVVVGMQVDAWSVEAVVASRRAEGALSWRYWSTVFSNAEGTKVMFLASVAGTLAAFAFALAQPRLASGARPIGALQALKAWSEGVTGFRHAAVILVLAWAIRVACEAVHTSEYLSATLGRALPPALLPVVIFLLAALVAFAIGTSWATMAILLPTSLPLAYGLGGLPLTVLVAAAVLDGAIFGDHCSPISDTTVLSSIASSCDHLDHVKTQMPYALATMAIAATAGYLGTSLLYPAWVGLILGMVLVVALLKVVGQDPEAG